MDSEAEPKPRPIWQWWTEPLLQSMSTKEVNPDALDVNNTLLQKHEYQEGGDLTVTTPRFPPAQMHFEL